MIFSKKKLLQAWKIFLEKYFFCVDSSFLENPPAVSAVGLLQHFCFKFASHLFICYHLQELLYPSIAAKAILLFQHHIVIMLINYLHGTAIEINRIIQ